MKLQELANVVSKGNATTLTGGPLPNAFTDDATKQSKTPRKKKRDAYGGVGYVYPHSYSNPYNGEDSAAGDSGGDGGDGGGGE